MPTFRLLHAAGWDPNAVLPDAPHALTDVFETALCESLSVLIDSAIELEVDAVVLMPAEPADGVARGPSHRVEAHFRESFARLGEVGISGVVAVGFNGECWKVLAGSDAAMIMLSPGDVATLPQRDDRIAARFRCIGSLRADEHWASSKEALEILLAPSLSTSAFENVQTAASRYVALGSGERGTLSIQGGVAHAPGPLQSLGKATGRRGATLVTLEATGQTRTEAVPCAVLRFESINVEAKPQDALDDLAVRMTERLEELTSEPCERAWLVGWTIEAAEPLFSKLNDPRGRADLVSLLPDRQGDVVCAHEIRVAPHAIWPALDDPFSAEFEAALQEQISVARKGQSPLLPLPDAMPHRKRLARFVHRCDLPAVLGDARRFGLRVTLAASQDEDSA
jgi:hypothetical protein